MQNDVRAEEDGRGGYDFDTRSIGPHYRTRKFKNACKWCGNSSVKSYHDHCLQVKKRIEALEENRDIIKRQ